MTAYLSGRDVIGEDVARAYLFSCSHKLQKLRDLQKRENKRCRNMRRKQSRDRKRRAA